MEAARFGEGGRVRVLCGRAGTVMGPESFCQHRPPPPLQALRLSPTGALRVAMAAIL